MNKPVSKDKPAPGKVEYFAPGQVLFQQGDASDHLIFIKEGEVDVVTESDGIRVVLGNMKTGEVLGTVTLFTGEPRSATAVARTQCTVQLIPSEQVRKTLSDVQPWMQSVVKDTVARLRYVNSQLISVTHENKSLTRKVGTVYDQAAQISALLGALAKVGMKEYEGMELFGLNGFPNTAESVLGLRAERVEKIYQSLVKSGLVKEFPNQKFGPSLVKERVAILGDFANFARKTLSTGDGGFVPVKFQVFLSCMVKLAVANKDKTKWETKDLLEQLQKQVGRDVPDDFLKVAKEKLLVSEVPGTPPSLTYAAGSIQKRIIFESTWRLLGEITFED